MIYLFIAICALLASSYGALIGFGGGVFIVPILVLGFHYPMNYAVGAVTLSLVPSALITTLLNHKEGHVDYATGTILEIPTVVGVIAGSALVSVLPTVQLQYIFVIAITIVGISFLRRRQESTVSKDNFISRINKKEPGFNKKDKNGNILYRVNYLLATFFGLLSGTLAGLLGIGGGFLKTPIMIKAFKMPAKIAAGTALFMIVITSITSSVSHYILGHVVWNYALPVLAGFIIGPFIAIWIKRKLTSAHLEKLVGISLILAACLMLVNIFMIKGSAG